MVSIRKDVTKGVFWIAVAKYSGIVVQLVITAILARIIAPAAFGTIAVSMVILSFLNIWADIGIGPAVVQYKNLTKRHLDCLFTLNIYIGFALSAILYMSSGLISTYYGDEILESVCRMMAIVIFFHSLNVVPNALMRKDKRFRTIALRTLIFQVLGGSIAVFGAFRGWGIYALLVSPILTAVGVFCVNFYNYPQRYVVKVDKEAFGMIASFSLFQFAFTFCNYFSRNLDKLIIGRYCSLEQLGYYDKSYHLMQLPMQNITFVIEPVLHPILSTLQDNKKELSEKNQKLAVFLSNISFPIGLLLYFCGGEIIQIIYGDQWDAAIPVFKILALSLPLQMILSTSGAIYQAAGKTKHMFFNGIINTAVTICGFFIAAYCGGTIEAMALAWDITLTINFVTSYWIMHRFSFGEHAVGFYKALGLQCLNSVIVFVVTSYICWILSDINEILLLFVKLFFVVTGTLIVAYFFKQYNLQFITDYLTKLKQ